MLRFKATWVVELVGGRVVKIPDTIEVESIQILEEFLDGNEELLVDLLSQKANLPIVKVREVELKLNTD